jgi:transcriptional regulator with XRE-family HTH domain
MLKQVRERRGMTQARLAEQVGTTQEYIAMIERGTRKNPSLVLLQKLAKALKATVGRLVE